ncbi:MAG: hypothetical protein PHC61_12010 [Chitinivibrionales bacterium]|nr:hypothetical protein [Chitinivibrionales bacterium]
MRAFTLNSRCIVQAALFCIIGMGASAFAAGITWGAPTNIHADADISTTGTLKYAYNWSGTNVTVNGVTFTGTTSKGAVGNDILIAVGTPWLEYGNFWVNGRSSALSANYQKLLSGANFADYEGDYWTLQLKNLVSGKTYQIQVWASGYWSDNGIVKISDPSNSSVSLNKDGQFAIGTFTASATSLLLTLSGLAPFVPDKGAILNAIQLREVSGTGVIAINRNVAVAGSSGKAALYDIRGRLIGISENGLLPQGHAAGAYLLKSGASSVKLVPHGAVR